MPYYTFARCDLWDALSWFEDDFPELLATLTQSELDYIGQAVARHIEATLDLDEVIRDKLKYTKFRREAYVRG